MLRDRWVFGILVECQLQYRGQNKENTTQVKVVPQNFLFEIQLNGQVIWFLTVDGTLVPSQRDESLLQMYFLYSRSTACIDHTRKTEINMTSKLNEPAVTEINTTAMDLDSQRR